MRGQINNKLNPRSSSNSRLPLINSYSEENKDSKSGSFFSNSSSNPPVSMNIDFPPCSHFGQYNKSVGVCSKQGRRPYQEDMYSIHPILSSHVFSSYIPPHLQHNYNNNYPETAFFGLFDGHAGGQCSKFLGQRLANNLLLDPNFSTNLSTSFVSTFLRTNEEFLKDIDGRCHAGSTGLCAAIRDNKLFVANVGDCRAVLVRTSSGFADQLKGSDNENFVTFGGSSILQITTDHKPSSIEEQKRIQSLGGQVVNCMGVYRVNRVLAVSRAFGNRTLKNVIIPDADIYERNLTSLDDFFVMASDGLWDVLSLKDIVEACNSPFLLKKPQLISDHLVNLSLSRGSMDNVTCIVVNIKDFMKKDFKFEDKIEPSQANLRSSIEKETIISSKKSQLKETTNVNDQLQQATISASSLYSKLKTDSKLPRQNSLNSFASSFLYGDNSNSLIDEIEKSSPYKTRPSSGLKNIDEINFSLIKKNPLTKSATINSLSSLQSGNSNILPLFSREAFSSDSQSNVNSISNISSQIARNGSRQQNLRNSSNLNPLSYQRSQMKSMRAISSASNGKEPKSSWSSNGLFSSL